ncbi:MAG: hypothetical protein ACU0GG_04695 [Paracoccaceae bacterium]
MTTYHPNSTTEHTEDAISMGERLRANSQDSMTHAQERAADAAKEVEKTVTSSVDAGAKFVCENPAVALAGAAGTGILIGLSLGNRR